MSESRFRVLVVDDDAQFALMVGDSLGEGFEARVTTSPEEALELARQADFDAAVVDIVMPGLSGLELAERLHEVQPDLQVVVLTGHANVESAIEGIHRAVYDFIKKADLHLDLLEGSARRAAQHTRGLRERRELLQQLEESKGLLEALHEIGTSLGGQPHLDRLLAKLVESAKALCGAEAGRVVLLQGSDDIVVGTAVGDGATVMQGMHLRPGEGIALRALESGADVLAEDARSHPSYSTRCDEMPEQAPVLLCVPLTHGGARGALSLAGRTGGALAGRRGLAASLARYAAVAMDNALQHERALNFFTHTSDMLVAIMDAVDSDMTGHARAVAALADMVTRRLGLDDAERRSVHFAALLHDIGKARLDPAVLRGSPTDPGWRSAIETHPALALEMLRPITLWEGILPMVHCHHERWDGRGYPLGLAGEQIPLGARVIAVTDAFDAMTRRAPRRTPAEALVELETHAGSQFDPRVVRLFLASYRRHAESGDL